MKSEDVVYRHSVITRLTHWVGALAFFILVLSGLQIFNAAPHLEAADKSDPAKRVLEIGADEQGGKPAGYVDLLGWKIPTTHVLGYTSDGMGGETERAFPGWVTLPGYQSLADGRHWHLFFGWFLVGAGLIYIIGSVARKDFGLLILRPSDVPKLIPMQLYYLRLRKEPPHYGKYNPLQKLAYTIVLFVFSPLIVISGLALSPGVDSWMPWLTWALGGRQFARLWHFVLTMALTGFLATHLILVFSTGFFNNMRSMITGWYKLGKHEGLGA
jgi:thiosulfate reductase cytochrome b subunit